MRYAMRALYVFRSPDASVILDKMILMDVPKYLRHMNEYTKQSTEIW